LSIVYCSFDVFPSPKGAAVHIEAFARALGRAYGGVDLVTIAADGGATSRTPWLDQPAQAPLGDGVTHHGLSVQGPNLIARALHFRGQLKRWWGRRRARIVHVRGIFEGYPIATCKGRLCDKLVVEPNGLPSIELKYHYPKVAEDAELLAKLEAQERRLLRAADLVITPSEVTARELGRRGAAEEQIAVIPNGVDEQLFWYREPPELLLPRVLKLIYAGTVTAWQGVVYALEALRLLRRDHPAELTLVGPLRRRQRAALEAQCRALGVADHVVILPPLSQAELLTRYHQADVALVPLPHNDRNVVQGCCPLKLIEAMAAGVPVVASDLPVVRALAEPDVEVIAVRPSSAKAIKDGLLRLLGEPALGARLARAARRRVEGQLTWRHSCARLIEAYSERLGVSSAP